MNAKNVETKIKSWQEKLQDFIQELSSKNETLHVEALQTLSDKVKSFENFIPIIESCSNKDLRQRHWDQVITM